MEWREDDVYPEDQAGEGFSIGGAPWLQALSDRFLGKRDQPNPIGTLAHPIEESAESLEEEETGAA